MTLSTSNLADFSAPYRLRELFRSLAILDAILEPRISKRSFFFLDSWTISDSIGTIRIGDDHLFAAFGESGAFIKGYVKQCLMGMDGVNWPGIDAGLPREFMEWRTNPYFEFERTTFCLWRLADQSAWQTCSVERPLGDDPDGSAVLLKYLDGNAEIYAKFASERRGEAVDVDAVGYILDQGFVTESILRVLNPEVEFKSLAHDLRATGYPLRSPL